MWGNLGRVLTEQQATSMDMIRREFVNLPIPYLRTDLMAVGPMGVGAHGFHTQWVRVQNFTHGSTPDPY
jgi:hypothetical protein